MPETPKTIVMMKLDELSPDPNNIRKHDAKNVEAIKASLRKFGQVKPIVISEENVIIAGNGTYVAAKELGLPELSCIVVKMGSAEAMAYAIADNRTAELASWDLEGLHGQMKALDLDGFAPADIGFQAVDVDLMHKRFDEQERKENEDALKNIAGKAETIRPVEYGEVWAVGPAIMIVCDPIDDLQAWRPYLTDAVEFVVPYCSFLAPVTRKYEGKAALFLQPDGFAAALLIDHLKVSRPDIAPVERMGEVKT